MGLLGNIIQKVGQSKIGQTVFKPGGVVDTITKPAQAIGVIVSNPITAITKGYGAAKQKVLNESVEKSIGKVILNTGTVAAAVVTGGTAAGRAAVTTAVPKIVKAITPTTPKAILTTAIAAPIAIGVLKETKKPLEAITKAPGALTAFGSDVGKAIENPSISSITNIVKENPTVSAIAGGLAIGAGAGALVTGIGALENIKTRESVQELTSTLGNQLPATTGVTSSTDTSKALQTEQKPFSPTTAVTPATAPLAQTTTRKVAKMKTRKQVPQAISQRVNVVVQNKNTSTGIKSQSKNYLKREVYA